jgi:hypothetical protein
MTRQETRAQFRRVLAARCALSAERTDALVEILARRDATGDDRRMCLECACLSHRSHCCQVAVAGRMRGFSTRYEPVPDLLGRCEFFKWSMP